MERLATPAEMSRVYRCDVCERDLQGIEQFEAHKAGKRHKAVQKERNRKEEWEEEKKRKVSLFWFKVHYAAVSLG
jgi:hypothetical protein